MPLLVLHYEALFVEFGLSPVILLFYEAMARVCRLMYLRINQETLRLLSLLSLAFILPFNAIRSK
jgi:hypothetical protein